MELSVCKHGFLFLEQVRKEVKGWMDYLDRKVVKAGLDHKDHQVAQDSQELKEIR